MHLKNEMTVTGLSAGLFLAVVTTCDYHDVPAYGIAVLFILIFLCGILAGTGMRRP